MILGKVENKKWESYVYTFDLDGILKKKVKCDAYTGIAEAYVFSPLYVGDLDNDGVDEIVASAGVYNIDGTERWSYDIFVETIMGPEPKLEYVKDLDGDGVKEIIAISPDNLHGGEEALLLVFDADGNVLFNKNLFSEGKCGGIDGLYVEDINNDGKKEIIVVYARKIVVFGSKE